MVTEPKILTREEKIAFLEKGQQQAESEKSEGKVKKMVSHVEQLMAVQRNWSDNDRAFATTIKLIESLCKQVKQPTGLTARQVVEVFDVEMDQLREEFNQWQNHVVSVVQVWAQKVDEAEGSVVDPKESRVMSELQKLQSALGAAVIAKGKAETAEEAAKIGAEIDTIMARINEQSK